MRCNIFTYGSLMFPAVWEKVVCGRYRCCRAMLHAHARYAIAGADYPGLVAQPGAAVEGVLYTGVEREDVERLDRFEGAEYRRVAVQVQVLDKVPGSLADSVPAGSLLEAHAYLYGVPQRLLAEPWDSTAFDIAGFLRAHGPSR